MYNVKNKSYPLTVHKNNRLNYESQSSDSIKYKLKVNQTQSVFMVLDIEITDREMDIIELLGLGKTSDEMADILNISPHTVQSHKKNILKKTLCQNSTHLVASCIRSGILK